jgi:hypothetical protein
VPAQFPDQQAEAPAEAVELAVYQTQLLERMLVELVAIREGVDELVELVGEAGEQAGLLAPEPEEGTAADEPNGEAHP